MTRRTLAAFMVVMSLLFCAGASRPTKPTILFVRYPQGGGTGNLMLMDVDGGNERALLDVGGIKSADWSPDGTRIVYATGHMWELRLRSYRDGREETVDIPEGATSPDRVRWSGDESRVAFQAWTGDPQVRDVYVLDLVTRDLINLSRHRADDEAPAWSPDGNEIAFSSNRDPAFWRGDRPSEDIYAVGARGGAIRNLTRTKVREHYPAYSPDGAQLAFMRSAQLTTNGEAWVMDLATGRDTLVETPYPVLEIAWAPDGKRLVLTVYDAVNAQLDIAVVAVDGSDFRLLTDTLGHHEVQPRMFDPQALGVSPRDAATVTWGALKGQASVR